MKLEFNLVKGMTSEDIVRILKGRVSGESAQEIQPFFAESEIPFKESEPAEREVLEADGEYAYIVRRRQAYKTEWNEKTKVFELVEPKEIVKSENKFMAGINDEGKYFLHGVDMMPGNITGIENIMNWMNKVEQGYVTRIQGDMLCQFLLRSQRVTEDNLIVDSPSGAGVRRNPWDRGSMALAQRRDGRRTSYSFPGNITSTYWMPVKGHEDEYSGSMFPQPTKDVHFGNHRISTDGFIVVSQNSSNPEIIIDGTRAILQHGQHGLKTMEIPEHHVLAITAQRGRQMSMQQGMGFRGTVRIYGAD